MIDIAVRGAGVAAFEFQLDSFEGDEVEGAEGATSEEFVVFL